MTVPSQSARVAIVTGATSGIGAAIATRLLADGWSVEALGRDREALDALADPGHSEGGKLHGNVVDLADELRLQEWAAAFGASHSELHALVHCAGVVHRGAAADTTKQALDEQFAVNFRAPWTLTMGLLAALEAGQGYTIFMNSSQGLSAGGDAVGYAASKHAARALADGLRAEVNDRGIRICTLYPGRTATPGQRKILEYEGRDYQPERLIDTADIAELVSCILNLSSAAEVTDVTLRPARKLGPR